MEYVADYLQISCDKSQHKTIVELQTHMNSELYLQSHRGCIMEGADKNVHNQH